MGTDQISILKRPFWRCAGPTLQRGGRAERSLDLGIVVNVDKHFEYLLQKEFTVAGLCDGWGEMGREGTSQASSMCN